jgi:aryl-alcohol dehydrogenase-like predicted oxidoreductase
MQARPQRSLRVCALGRLGISDFDGDGYVRQSIATIARALYLGSTMLDTANVYGP